eukprot:1157718-Pelagomonas_calceolata.AAC.1
MRVPDWQQVMFLGECPCSKAQKGAPIIMVQWQCLPELHPLSSVASREFGALAVCARVASLKCGALPAMVASRRLVEELEAVASDTALLTACLAWWDECQHPLLLLEAILEALEEEATSALTCLDVRVTVKGMLWGAPAKAYAWWKVTYYAKA